MAKPGAISSKAMTVILYLLLLLCALEHAASARILDEVFDPQPPIADEPVPVTGATTTLPSGETTETSTGTTPVADKPPLPQPTVTASAGTASVVAPAAAGSSEHDVPDAVTSPADEATLPEPSVPTPVAAPAVTDSPDHDVPDTVTPPVAEVAPAETPAAQLPSIPASTPATAATVAEHSQLSFFMHDILGGTHPSGRVVTGIVANSGFNNLPFSKPNSQVFPMNGGIPLNTITGVINNNNAPFLVGLSGSPGNTVVQNSGNNNVVNNGNNLPFVSAGQLPSGLTLQQLMFGSITVVDNEITEGHELGSLVLGQAQGFYLTSSTDGTSHTLVLTALFHGGEHEVVHDTISFFGIHRTGSPVSQIAVIGGTGKYENAGGYATIEALPPHDQHTTDGVETITQFNVYLTPH